MPAGGRPSLSMNACGAISGRPMRTFHELVVIVLQSRALLSHVCFSTCTPGCMGLHCCGVGLAFVGLGYRAEPTDARRVASCCVLVWFAAQPPAADRDFLPAPHARAKGSGCT